MATIVGTPNNDPNLNGTPQSDQIFGGGGRDTLRGGGGADELYGELGDDSLFGDAGNDELTGGAGRDTIDGGADIDTAYYSGLLSDYSISTRNGATTIRDLRKGSPDGTDTLTNVERIEFADGTIYYLVANRSPTAIADTWTVLEDGVHSSTTSLLANDVDLDGDEIELISINGTGLRQGSASITLPSGASLTVTNTGNYTFNTQGVYDWLATGEVATEVIDYQVADQFGGVASATLTITITGTNDAVMIVAANTVASGTVVEDSATTADPTDANQASGTIAFADVDLSDSHNASATASPANTTSLGTFLLGGVSEAAGAAGGIVDWTYTIDEAAAQYLAAGQSVTETFVVTLADGNGSTTSQDVVVTITGTNDRPVAAADAAAALEAGIFPGNNATGNVLTNDTDVDQGTVLIVSGVSLGNTAGTVGASLQGAFGRLTLNANGSYTYVVDQNNSTVQALASPSDTLSETFTYEVSDGNGGIDTAELTVTISGQNDAPNIVADASTATEAGTAAGSDASGNVLINDSDYDAGDSLEVYAIEAVYPGATFFRVGDTYQSLYGTFTINADGSYTYVVDNSDPAVQALSPGQSLTERFFYNARDDAGWARAAFLTITIEGANDAPVVTGAVQGTATEDGASSTLDALANASDVDNGTILSVVNIQPVLPAGVTYDAATQSFMLDPSHSAYQSLAVGEQVGVTVDYSVSDGSATTAGSLSWTVTGTNDAPVAADDVFTSAQPAVGGTEYQANTYTNHLQEAPATVGLADGSYVIVWESFGQDGSNEGIYGQRYDALGNPVSTEFQVNTYTAGYQKEPSITGLADGGFLVTWSSENQDGHGYGIFARRYDASGLPVAGEFQVNSSTLHSQNLSDAAELLDGGFVVVWSSSNQDGSGTGTYGQRYDANGVAVGSEFRVNSYTTGDQQEPSVAALSDGGFIVTWHSLGQDGSGQGIYGQRYDVSGTPIGGEFRANSTTNGDQVLSSVVGLSGGGFVVTWSSNGQDGSGFGVYGQRYDAGGVPVGAEFRINSHTASDQLYPSAVGLGDGGFIVTWTSQGQDGSGSGIYGQRFDAAGQPVGGEFRVNALTSGNQAVPSVAFVPGTGFVVAWESITSSAEVQARVFDAPPVVTEDGPLTFQASDLLANDTDVDGDTLTIAAASNNSTLGASVTLNPDGTITYDPRGAFDHLAAGQSSTDSFTYTVSDGNGGTDTATVSITIRGVNDAPAVSSTFLGIGLTEGTGSITLDMLTNAFDVDSGAVLSVQNVTNLTQGITWNGTQLFFDTSDPAFNYLGHNQVVSLTVNYEIVDEHGASIPRSYFFNLLGRNDAPVAADDTSSTDEDSVLSVVAGGVLANDNDVDANDAFVVSAVQGSATNVGNQIVLASGAFVTMLADGSYSYDPNGQFAYLAAGGTADDTFTYTISDGNGGTDTATVTITVDGTNDAPLAVDDVAAAVEDDPVLTGSVAGNDSDVDLGAVLSYTLVDPAPSGFALDAQGNWTFDPSHSAYQSLLAGEELEILVPYTVTDEHGATDSATLTITVTGTHDNTAPVTVDDDGAIGTPEPRGAEFQINTYFDFFQLAPTLAPLADGGFLASWASTFQDSSEYGIYAQRFDSNGSPVGGEFRVNTLTNSDQEAPSAAGLLDGGFVITWETWATGLGGSNIHGQRYDAAGNPVGGEFAISTIPNNQSAPSVTALSNGGFLVTWQSQIQDGSGWGIYARQYDSVGNPLTAEYRVNTYTANDQITPVVAALDDGGFVVAWRSNGQDGSGWGIYAQRYDASGIAAGSEFLVNSTTVNFQIEPTITGLADGGFVVLWTTDGIAGDGNSWGIRGQRFDATGSAVGPEFLVNSFTAGEQSSPSVTALADGGFAVTWNSFSQDGSGYGVYGQRFDAVGNSVGNEFAVSSFTASDQMFPAVVGLRDGGFAVAWQSSLQDGSGTGIFAQLFATGFSTDEDTSLVLSGASLLANDADVDGDALTITSVGALSNLGAVVALNADGTIIYDPSGALDHLPEGQVVEDSFTYTVSDGNGGTDTATVFLTVRGVNDAPAMISYDAIALFGAPSAGTWLTYTSNTTSTNTAPRPTSINYTFSPAIFTDPDGDMLTWSVSTIYSSTGQQPTWLGLDPATGTLSGSTLNQAAGTYLMALSATDPFGLSVNHYFTVTVTGGSWLDGRALPNGLSSGGYEVVLQPLTFTGNANMASGHSVMIGGSGPGTVHGGTGDDVLVGDGGVDLLYGDLGNDVLWGGDGADTLQGNENNDVLLGGAGADSLSGGAGADIFVLAAGWGTDNVIDWDTDDRIDVASAVGSPINFTAWLAEHVTISGGNTVIDLDGPGPGTDTIVLLGFTGVLNTNDFIFAP